MLNLTLDFAGTEIEAQNAIAQALQAFPDATYEIEPHGPGGGNPEITVQSANAADLQLIAQAVYNEVDDFSHLIN